MHTPHLSGKSVTIHGAMPWFIITSFMTTLTLHGSYKRLNTLENPEGLADRHVPRQAGHIYH